MVILLNSVLRAWPSMLLKMLKKRKILKANSVDNSVMEGCDEYLNVFLQNLFSCDNIEQTREEEIPQFRNDCNI